jgi:hypothetical protein
VHQDLCERAESAEQEHVQEMRPADPKAGRVAHGAEIGADIDRIGDEQQGDDRLQQPIWIVNPQVAGDAFSGGAADPPADFLDHGHQRIAEQHQPADGETELRSRL